MTGVHRLPDEAALENAVREARARGLVERVLRTPLRTKADFLTALAEAFGFPGYFGHNWDAASECLADLEAEGPGWALVYRGASEFERTHPEEFATALTVLAEAAEQQAVEGRTLAVLLGP